MTRSVSKAFKNARFGDPHQMAKMFFSAHILVEKCAELESQLSSVRPAKIVKRRRSEYTPIQSAAKRPRSLSQPQLQPIGTSDFEDDGERRETDFDQFEDDPLNLRYDGDSDGNSFDDKLYEPGYISELLKEAGRPDLLRFDDSGDDNFEYDEDDGHNETPCKFI